MRYKQGAWEGSPRFLARSFIYRYFGQFEVDFSLDKNLSGRRILSEYLCNKNPIIRSSMRQQEPHDSLTIYGSI